MRNAFALTALIQNVFKHQRDFLDGNISKQPLDRFIMAAGYEPCNNGIWADADVVGVLRAAGTLTLDWAHCAANSSSSCDSCNSSSSNRWRSYAPK